MAQAVQAQAAPTEPALPPAPRLLKTAEAAPAPPERRAGEPGPLSTGGQPGAAGAAAVIAPVAPATPTAPRPRRLTDPAQPTSTPILLAFAHSEVTGASESAGHFQTQAATPDRRFHLALLPGYGAYLLTAGLLLAVGAIITRRRSVRSA
jgi:hypothetical protein